MVPESFSFPKITYPLPNFAISPSLWRVSSVVYPAEEAQDHEESCRKIKSFSNLEYDDDQVNIDRELREEKMDMLWEDFNEELQRVSINNPSMDENEKSAERVRLSNSENTAELCCVQDLNTSGTGSGMIFNNKRPSSSIVVVMKALKKIFFLKNSSRINKN